MSRTFTDDVTKLLPTNFVTRQQLSDWVQYQQPQRGTVLGELQLLTNVGVVKVEGEPNLRTATLLPSQATGELVLNQPNLSSLRQYQVDRETLSTSGQCDPNKLLTVFSSTSGGPYAMSLAAGNYVGQLKMFSTPMASTQVFVLSATFTGFASITFGSSGGGIGYTALLEWDGGGWSWQGGNALIA